MNLSIESISKLAELDRIAFKRHRLLRMHQRGVRVDDVRTALISGQIIETYEGDKPLPSYLILGYSETGRAIHAVVAIDVLAEMIWVITVYEPSLKEWEEAFKVRRKP